MRIDMRISIVATIIAAAIAIAAPARAGAVRHVPPAEATAGEPIELTAELIDATDTTLVVRYRAASPGLGAPAGPWREAPFARKAGLAWIAEIPAAEVAPPGVEYFLVSGDRDALGSASWPVAVAVHRAPDLERADRDLVRAGGRRSRVHVLTEYVDYGGPSASTADHYYRVDADFSYRLLAYPLEELRFGYTRLVGTTSGTPEAGFKVAGWFELGFGLAEGLRLDARGIVAATQGGFALGTRAELRLGDRDRTHVATGVEYLADVGTTGFFRLGWATVPGAPMATTVEITDLPAATRPAGVRLLYDVAHPFPSGLRVGARVGYAARDERYGGVTGGVSASFDF
jgi:hypothetical protein